ncbi:elongator complex protein 6 [Bacillus rossius redtenbacheri]|uniref:elongator complex protein 6 n=1 Tax=Bacillus rossius redtenbacheri TaxID=93214 RepID=UPI002FDDD35B
MDPVIGALGLDGAGASGRQVAVVERGGGDATFVVCSLLGQALREGRGACLLLLHSSFGHHHNVGVKLGYNLRQLRAQGRVEVLEAGKLVEGGLAPSGGEPPGAQVDAWAPGLSASTDVFSGDKEGLARALFLDVRSSVQRLARTEGPALLVVDDLSDLLSLGVPVAGALSFLRYCRALPCGLTARAHADDDDEEQRVLAAALAHGADVCATVAGLGTGRSAQVSGTLAVRHKRCADAPRWNRQSLYHFRLQDRHVRLFAPGEVT